MKNIKGEIGLVTMLLILSIGTAIFGIANKIIDNSQNITSNAAGSCSFESVVNLVDSAGNPLMNVNGVKFTTNIESETNKFESDTRSISTNGVATGKHLITNLDTNLKNKPLSIKLSGFDTKWILSNFTCQNKTGDDCDKVKNTTNNAKLVGNEISGIQTVCGEKYTFKYFFENASSPKPTSVAMPFLPAPTSASTSNGLWSAPAPANVVSTVFQDVSATSACSLSNPSFGTN